jgi:hypothetical protein
VRCDVAVERPGAGVVGFELDDGVAVCRDEKCVPSDRIEGVDDSAAVPFAGARGEDEEIVPMHVHGVDCEAGVHEHNADGSVVAEVVDVPFGGVGIGVISFVGEKQNRVVVVLSGGQW